VDGCHLVVSVHQNCNVLGRAILSYGFVYIGHCCHSLSIFYYVYFDLNWIVSDKLLDQLISVIGRRIIYYDYLVIFIVKVHHRLKVVLVSELFSVVEGWNHNAER